MHRIDRKSELYKLAENFFRRSSEKARRCLLEALDNDPDILDELFDFILMNAEAEVYRQNPAFRQLLSLVGDKDSHLH
jgi:hypothetical protein